MITHMSIIYRWNRGKGAGVSKFSAHLSRQSGNYSYWEPNTIDFDYSSRSLSPLSRKAFESCSSDPTFDCSLQPGKWTCGSIENCPSLRGNKKGQGHCVSTGEDKCSVPENTKLPSILADLQLIRESTTESLPSCMAMYGPDIIKTIASASGVSSDTDACAPLFNVTSYQDDHGYLQWVKLNCERRTRALMCTQLGNFHVQIAEYESKLRQTY